MNRHLGELIRYVINGVVATGVHFAVLTILLKVVGVPSAGFANLIAAIFGIIASFLGSRYFVFPGTSGGVVAQAIRFSGLYAAIAVLHGVTLFVLTDRMGVDYRIAFLVATALQMSLSYVGNKFLVFKV